MFEARQAHRCIALWMLVSHSDARPQAIMAADAMGGARGSVRK
jgi:hypothetical protein